MADIFLFITTEYKIKFKRGFLTTYLLLSPSLVRLLNGHAATGDQDSLSQKTEFLLNRWPDGHHQGTDSDFEVGIATGDKGLEQHQRFLHRSESTDHPEPERNKEANPDRSRIMVSEGITRPGCSEVRRERSYRDQSMDDEVDAFISGSDRTVNRKQIGIKGSYGDDLLRSGGRTGEWVEERIASSGIEDLDIKYGQNVMWPSQIPPDETSAAYGSTDDNQVRMIQI